MTNFNEAAQALSGVSAAWDLQSFLANAKSYAQTVGGGLLMLLGVIGLIWGGVLLVKKLMAAQNAQGQQSSWGTIMLLVLVGGGLATGGFQLMNTIGSGGQQTIQDMGGGTVIVQTVDQAGSVSR